MNHNCTVDDKSCGMFWRRGFGNTTRNAITNIIKSANSDYHFLKKKANEIPVGIKEFIPDPELTLVVTWYKVPRYDFESVSANVYYFSP